MAGENQIAAGFKYVAYGVLNSSGIHIGNTLTGATAGSATGHPMIRLRGARTVPVELTEPERLTVLGDNEPLVQFQFPGAELPSGILEMSVRDQSFEALIQGTREESIGDLTAGALGPSGTSTPDMCLLLMREAKKYEGAVKGVASWEILFVPQCQIVPLFSNFTQREFNPYRYSIVLSQSGRAPYGPTYTELTRGTQSMTLDPIVSDNPVWVEVWQGNGSQATWTLTYIPKTTSKVYVYKNNGVRDPGATVSGQTITNPVAPLTGQYVHALYEVDAANMPD